MQAYQEPDLSVVQLSQVVLRIVQDSLDCAINSDPEIDPL